MPCQYSTGISFSVCVRDVHGNMFTCVCVQVCADTHVEARGQYQVFSLSLELTNSAMVAGQGAPCHPAVPISPALGGAPPVCF